MRASDISQAAGGSSAGRTGRRKRVHSERDTLGMKKVLIVDDSALVTARLSEAIGEIGNLAVAETAQREPDAIEILTRGGIDLVILDLHLDWGTGFGVLRSLLTINAPRPRVIVFTSYDLPEYRRQAIALGADHFLDKAQHYERLLELLHAYAQGEPGPPPTVQ